MTSYLNQIKTFFIQQSRLLRKETPKVKPTEYFSKFGLLNEQKMSQIISIEYPDYLANSMRMNKSEFEREIKISSLIKLFELGKISSGTASKVLQLSRIEFLELLAKYSVGFLQVEDLNEDFQNA
jgi:predicted HTH domain antitoxin